MKITIPTRVITYKPEQKEKWREGKVDDCTDSYCRRLLRKSGNTRGFGEYIAGKYYESLGYKWIHHDFNVFGYCKIGKYPEAEEIFRKYFGSGRFEQGRGLINVIPDSVKYEEPDLVIYKPDVSELFFVECKRRDTGDKVRPSQFIGLALLSMLYKCKVEICEIVEEGKEYKDLGEPMNCEFPLYD